MAATGLTVACLLAFLVVFFVLGVLAAAMVVITALFPVRAPVVAVDAATLAAIAGSVAALAPGARVTRVEEEP